MWIPMRLVKAAEIEYSEHCEVAKSIYFFKNVA